MKTLPVLASFAVTLTASAADLKDPTEVAREWNRTIEQARESEAPPGSLREQNPGQSAPSTRTFRSEIAPPLLTPRPPGRFYDAPSYRVPRVLPDNMPPGSKSWQFGDQTYWLIPLGPAGG